MTPVPRATRFPVVTRVLWRPHLRNEWSEAWSVNASQSGVLFRFERALHERPPAVGRQVDIIFDFSWKAFTLDSANIQCSGRVVRTDERDPAESFVASTIDSYTFLKPK